MQKMDDLRNEPPEYKSNLKELEFQKRNLLMSFFLLDIFIFVLIAALLDWITFINKEYLIFGSAFLVFMMLFNLIFRIISIKKIRGRIR